ncbi:hypothetical protein BGZ58_005470, partial [Dissophora ornata]
GLLAQQLVPQVPQVSQQTAAFGAVGNVAKAAAMAAAGVVSAGVGNLPVELMSKEDLLRHYQTLQKALGAGNAMLSKDIAACKVQLHKIQAELARPHRQQEMPRLGLGVIANGVLASAPGAIAAAAAAAAAGAGSQPPATIAALQQHQQQVPAAAQLQIISQQQQSSAAVSAELVPHIKELQQIQEVAAAAANKTVLGMQQPSVEPLELLTMGYKTLIGVDETGVFGDEVVTRESMFMLHNTFEGFVGKRVGNGPGKDMYDEGPMKKRTRRELKDEAIADELLWNDDGQPDAFIASYVDWAQEIETV